MATTSNDDLAQNLEKLVADFVRASQELVLAAVTQALASSAAMPATKAPSPPAPRKRAMPRKKRTPGVPRTTERIAELGERFYEALLEHPGETMITLAAKVGASPRELRYPVVLLMRAGRVRSVGQRQSMRYFPTTRTAEAA